MLTVNVLRHFAIQIGTGAALALCAYFAHADYSALGPYAALAQTVAALATSMLNEALGTAPK